MVHYPCVELSTQSAGQHHREARYGGERRLGLLKINAQIVVGLKGGWQQNNVREAIFVQDAPREFARRQNLVKQAEHVDRVFGDGLAYQCALIDDLVWP